MLVGSYSCMAQGDRDPMDKLDFNTMLPNMFLIYIGCKVLTSYISCLTSYILHLTSYMFTCSLSALGAGARVHRRRVVHGSLLAR